MKRILLMMTAAAILLFSANQTFAQDYSNAGDYMSAITKQQENVSKKYMAYTSASAHGKREKKVQSLRTKLMDEIQEAIGNINSLPSFKNDKSYRDTAVAFMKFYYNVMNDDYSKIINMEEIAEQSYDEMEAYLLLQEKVDKKMEEANTKMSKAQKDFGGKNNINIVEGKSELSEKMREATAVNKYYHEVYLVFFKPYIQEKNLMEAIKKNNLTGMEQNKSSMLKFAQEGLVKLAAMKGYNGDLALVGACKNLLNFYVKEADKTAVVNDFLLSKERFDGIKKEMDKKGDNRTKEDVDAYNKAVNEMNKSSNAYNSNNQMLNEQRNETLNNWNKGVKTFFDEFTPKYK
jgi:hypothetical protein